MLCCHHDLHSIQRDGFSRHHYPTSLGEGVDCVLLPVLRIFRHRMAGCTLGMYVLDDDYRSANIRSCTQPRLTPWPCAQKVQRSERRRIGSSTSWVSYCRSIKGFLRADYALQSSRSPHRASKVCSGSFTSYGRCSTSLSSR
jgi:hypothetical protein